MGDKGLQDCSAASTGLFCNRTFDDYACWPDGPPGSFVNVSCPWYLPWASSGECPLPCSQGFGAGWGKVSLLLGPSSCSPECPQALWSPLMVIG